MKRTFLLDENIIMFAQKLQNEYEDEDFTCASLITTIASKCHRIAINNDLKTKYYEKIQNMRQHTGLRVVKLIKYFLTNSDKHTIPWSITECPSKDEIPPDDLPIVELALSARAILVTSDGRLKNKIEKLDLLKKCNLEVLSPKEALDLC